MSIMGCASQWRACMCHAMLIQVLEHAHCATVLTLSHATIACQYWPEMNKFFVCVMDNFKRNL